tara:strand:- start:779 stop:1108 length:330 start_codon:yes stop_codon:yes gene_type:complete
MEDMVIEWIVKNELGGDLDRWEDEEWGFFDELSLKNINEEIFEKVQETGIETIIFSSNDSFKDFFNFAAKKSDIFFDKGGREITAEEWVGLVESSINCNISICECSANY